MDNRQLEGKQASGLDKIMKIAIIASVVLIAFSVVYYLFYRPHQKDSATKYCHQWANDEAEGYRGQINEKRYSEKFEWCMNEKGK